LSGFENHILLKAQHGQKVGKPPSSFLSVMEKLMLQITRAFDHFFHHIFFLKNVHQTIFVYHHNYVQIIIT